MVDSNTVIEGTVKFRDGKKWKSRWCVMRKLSPVADCLHLQLYRDSKERYKQGHTKASLSLQHFLAIETGFTLDKESNTIAIICQDVTVILAFDTRERLMQWQVKISSNLGEGVQYLIQVTSAPPKSKIACGPARLHVQDQRFCMASGVPPRLLGFWEIGHLRRYGVVEGRFVFEGGSRCGKGEGVHVCVTDQGDDITRTFQLAAQGKVATRRRPRNMSAMNSPRRQAQSRVASDLISAEALQQQLLAAEAGAGCRVCAEETSGSNENLFCSCRLHSGEVAGSNCGSQFWMSTESSTVQMMELDSNYGCGDTASVSDLSSEHHYNGAAPGRGGVGAGAVPPIGIERCMSCISKLGAMSRSSTVTTYPNTPATTPFNPAWTMDGLLTQVSSPQAADSVPEDSEYSVPRFINTGSAPSVPPKVGFAGDSCQCGQPYRPSKPPETKHISDSESPSKKRLRKPPMPLPLVAHLPQASSRRAVCTCRHVTVSVIEAHKNEVTESSLSYDNYDTPKSLFSSINNKEEKSDAGARIPQHDGAPGDYYDTPKNMKERLGNDTYDVPPSASCGCVVGRVPSAPSKRCPCQRVMCWAENWMLLPYCRRGNGIENTGVPIHKVPLSGEGKMPVVNRKGEIAIYATVDKSKKTSNRLKAALSVDSSTACLKGDSSNYVNVNLSGPHEQSAFPSANQTVETNNYENIDFAQSLEYYENSRDIISKVGTHKVSSEKSVDSVTSSFDGKVPISEDGSAKFCNKCGHAFPDDPPSIPTDDQEETGSTKTLCATNAKDTETQDDYLMMQPANVSPEKCTNETEQSTVSNKNFPGYLPMSPINSVSVGDANIEKVTFRLDQKIPCSLSAEKSISVPSLLGHVERVITESDKEFQKISGSAIMVLHHSVHTERFRRHVLPSSDDTRKKMFLCRKRSSSADSSRYLDEFDEFENDAERPLSTSQSNFCIPDRHSETYLLVPRSENGCTRERSDLSSTSCEPDISDKPTQVDEENCNDNTKLVKSLVIESSLKNPEIGSSENEAQIPRCITASEIIPLAVRIRRSSSINYKSGCNRDSSSSSDSGVSTCSLKPQTGADFTDFELPLTTSLSSRKHHDAIARHQVMLTNCLHASLPRRSKSVDPLRDITFQFQKIKIPIKSTSAEAEVPICPKNKGFQSPSGDSAIVVPYPDSRSTSSGTSDMSDYIETLSLSSHSSSDVPDSLRLGRQATTMLRPRSGKEYQPINQSILEGDVKIID